MYSKILVPLDGSKFAEQSLPYARAFAEAYGSPIELLKVNDPEAMAPYSPAFQGGEYLKEVSDRYFPRRCG